MNGEKQCKDGLFTSKRACWAGERMYKRRSEALAPVALTWWM